MKQPSDSHDTRSMRGFEPASGLLRDRIRKAGEQRGFAVTRLLTHWPEIAGPDLARMTRPLKISYSKGGLGGTLVLLTRAAHAPVVQMQLPVLRDRVNACYGYNAISRISLTQTAPTGFAEGQAVFEPAPPAPEPAPDPALAAEARETAEGVRDEDLRRALEALAQNVLNRSRQ